MLDCAGDCSDVSRSAPVDGGDGGGDAEDTGEYAEVWKIGRTLPASLTGVTLDVSSLVCTQMDSATGKSTRNESRIGCEESGLGRQESAPKSGTMPPKSNESVVTEGSVRAGSSTMEDRHEENSESMAAVRDFFEKQKSLEVESEAKERLSER